MSFVRPEAQAAMWRVREILAGVALGALGVWLSLGIGLTVWLGYALLGVALALLIVGVQRARFRLGGGGPGVVAVDEGQIGYFGPLTGGVLSLADLDRLILDPTGHPAHWILERNGQLPLQIPVNAEGAEALVDAFAALPGLRTERMLAELRGRTEHPVVIWEKQSSVPQHRQLH